MKKSRFSEEQMVAILREADQSPVTEVAKKHKVSEQVDHLNTPRMIADQTQKVMWRSSCRLRPGSRPCGRR